MWSNFGPYVVARFAASEKLGKKRGVSVIGLEMAGRLKAYPWIPRNLINAKVTLFPEKAVEEVSFWQYIHSTWGCLQKLKPDVLAICGYDQAAMLTALAWTKKNHRIAILMSESKTDDKPRSYWKEIGKKIIFRCFDAALVGGAPHREYAFTLGLPADRIFLGYDVVENDFFSQGANKIKSRQETWREKLGLPRPYFLSVSRFIDKKNIFRLIEAYKIYRQQAQEEVWDLVLCGDGPLAARLKDKAKKISGIHFPGFKQVEDLIPYYGLAGVFVMPSSNFEQWGLVVNEAMASGLPVLVSRACGCAQDLVQEGINGFTFDPYDVEEIAKLMIRMSSGKEELRVFQEASRRIISHWTPEIFAQNLFVAIDACLEKKYV
jgi:glycosyltransferase involved in cell wall biosynthesis